MQRADDESEAHMSATAEAWAADSDDESGLGPSPADRHGIAGADDDSEEEPIPRWTTAGGYLPPQGTTESELPSSSAASHSVPNPAHSCPPGNPRTSTSRPRAFSKSSFELIDHRDFTSSHKISPRPGEYLSQLHGDTSEQHEKTPEYHEDSSKQNGYTSEQHNDSSGQTEDDAQEQEDTYSSHEDWDNLDDGDDSDYDFSRVVSPADPMDSDNENHGEDWQQAGENADARDLAGIGVHGRLDVSVGEPRKENEGTQNQYISYLVTTDVGVHCSPLHAAPTNNNSRPISNRSSPLTSPPAVASPILSSFTKLFAANTHNAQSRLYQTSTRWSMFEETGSDKTSPLSVHTPLSDSASVYHYIQCSVVRFFLSFSWRAMTGMRP